MPDSADIPLIPYSTSTIVDPQTTTVAINLFGSSKYRQFSKTEAYKLLNLWLRDFPQDTLYLIPVPGKIEFLKELVTELENPRVQLLSETPSLAFSLQLLSQVDLCVTPDTSVVHMASALNTPILAIYADDPRNFQEWHPLSDKAEVVFNPPAKGRNDRVYVHDFEWSGLKQKRESLLSSH
ncbi:glycosyltransferase family 9 protein [Vibrio fluvialis]|uniref:glycosyltransferase family 9 protein n=1 Tax=Vibrio fluvialis TaxID=676 RepID=UPI0030D89F77